MIESVQNSQVKRVRRLQNSRRFRQKEATFVVEGSRWLEELLTEIDLVTAVYFTKAWRDVPENEALLTRFATCIEVSTAVMREMSDTDTPAGVLATVTIAPSPLPLKLDFCLLLDGVADPGNVGTLIRTAAAADVDGVILTPGCVDLYNPKVVRSTAGSVRKLPIYTMTWEEIGDLLDGLSIYGLDAGGTLPYTAVDWKQPSALIVGNEGHGLSQQGKAIAQHIVSIPMGRRVESLNASVAGSIVLFEGVRQRLTRRESEREF